MIQGEWELNQSLIFFVVPPPFKKMSFELILVEEHVWVCLEFTFSFSYNKTFELLPQKANELLLSILQPFS